MSDIIELQDLDSSVIHHFVSENNLTGLKEIVLQYPSNIDILNETHQTALHLACELGYVELTNFLLDHGASVNIRDHNEFSPFLSACYNGHLECAQSLINYLTDQEGKVNIDQQDKNGWSSLMWAVYKGHTAIVKVLLDYGASMHASVAYNATCLLWAAGRGHSEIVQLLCQKGAKVDHVDKYGNTSMIWAARRGYTDIVLYLMEWNADPNITSASSCSSLIMAVKGGHKECSNALLSNSKVQVNKADRDGRTALSYAAKQGSVEIISKLLERGAYLNLPDNNGDTPLIKAVKYGHLEAVKVLLSHFANVDVKGKDSKTALHLACENKSIPIIRELLKCGCKVECMNSNKETPLLRAVKEGNVKVTKVLLDSGADVSACDRDHNTCVHVAIRAQNIQLVELILQNPKHARFLYQENRFGETPYDIDLHSNKKILAQLFGSKGFSTAAMSNDSSLDVTSCSLAEMLSEPMLEPPLNIALFAKWGNNVNFMLNKVKGQIKLFACPSTALNTNMFWITLSLLLYLSILVSLFMAFMFPQRLLAGLLTFFITMFICSAFLVLIYVGARYNKWEWSKSASKKLHQIEDYFKLILQICFLYQGSPSSAGRVRYIFAECMNVSSFKENDMLSGITTILLQSLEGSMGKLAFRIARSLPASASHHSEEWKAYRKLCCIPSFVLVLVWIVGSSLVILLAVALFGPSPVVMSSSAETTAILVICVLSVLFGLLFVLMIITSWKVFLSLFFQTSKINSKLSNEVNQNRYEVARLARALSTIDSIKKTKTRICLLINGLDVNDQAQLAPLVHAVHTVYSVHPVVTVTCIDYQAVTTALQKTSLSFYDGGDFNSNAFVHHVIQLPLFLPDKNRKKRLLLENDVVESESDFEEHEPYRRKKYPKHFDVTKWLVSHDCFQPVNPLLIKRVASIISFTARLLRSAKKDFSWNALSPWLVLTELWPYSTTCMIAYISRKNPSRSKSLKSLYCEIRHLILTNHTMDVHDSSYLLQFITSKSCSLTVADVINFHAFTVNLNPALEDLIPTFNDSWTTHSGFIQGSTVGSSQVSMSSYEDVAVCDWTVEDVCRKLKSIQGLDTSNFQLYQSFVHKNNFHGLALSLCDVDELKKELKTSFGDWCLIKKFILETKRISTKSKRLSFASLASSGKKTSEAETGGTRHDDVQSDDNQAIAALSSSERVAYNKAFKEYLKLHPQSSNVEHNATHDAIVHQQLDNDNYPLLDHVDINAN